MKDPFMQWAGRYVNVCIQINKTIIKEKKNTEKHASNYNSYQFNHANCKKIKYYKYERKLNKVNLIVECELYMLWCNISGKDVENDMLKTDKVCVFEIILINTCITYLKNNH